MGWGWVHRSEFGFTSVMTKAHAPEPSMPVRRVRSSEGRNSPVNGAFSCKGRSIAVAHGDLR